MLAKYLVLTFTRRLEQVGGRGWVQFILTVAGLFFLGALFWLTSRANGSTVSLIGFFTISLISLGGWIGLRFISSHKPTGYYFISEDLWLWSEAAKGKLLALLVIAVTVLPYYLAKISNYSITQTISLAVLITIASMTLVTLGEVLAVAIRRSSRSVLIRFTLIILTVFLVLITTTSYMPLFKNIEAQLFINPLTNVLLPALLFFAGAAFLLVVLLEILFNTTSLNAAPTVKYWSANRLVKTFRFTNKPVTEAMLSSLIYTLRSAALQRRLLIILLAILTYPLFSLLFGIRSAQDTATFAIIGGLVLAVFYSIPLGQFANDQKTAFATLPQAKKLHPTAELVVTTIIVALISVLFANLLTPFPGAATATVIVCAVASAHIILFYSSYLAEQLRRRSTNQKSGNVVTIGLIVSFLLSLLAINFLGIVSNVTICILIILWTTVISWIFVRNTFYLNLKQA